MVGTLTEVIEALGRIAWGLLVAGCGLVAAPYLIRRAYRSSMRIGKTVAITVLLITGTLCADNGVGLVIQGDDSAHTVATEGKDASRLFIIFHGYGGDGRKLVELLSPYLLPHGTIVAFEPSSEGYDNDQVLRLALQEIDERHPDEIVVYGESFGGMVMADLLRMRPGLTLRGAVLNASPTKASQVAGGDILWITRLLHGGPLSTLTLRMLQQNQITAPVAFDQLSYIAEFTALSEGEFGNRVSEVRFVHAPGEEDGVVANSLASADWRQAFQHGRYTDVTMPWNEGEHAPTPARPGDIAKQLLAVAGIG